MTPKGLQEVDGRSQTAEAVFAEGAPKQPEEADRLIPLRRRLCDSLRNCLEDPLEPVRLDAPKNTAPKKKIPDGPNGLGRSGIVDYLLQNLVTGCQGTAHNLQQAAIVQLLEYFVAGQHGFRVFFRSPLEPRAQVRMRVAWRNF